MNRILLGFGLLILQVAHSQTSGNGVTDVTGIFYPSVIIGNQEWTTVNLKTTKFNDGVSIHFQPTNGVNNTPNLPQYSYNGNPDNGMLYNGFAVDNDNLVPHPEDGWRIATQADWDQLFITTGNSTGLPLTITNGLVLWNCPITSTNQYNFNLLANGKVSWNNTVNQVYVTSNYNTAAYYWKKGTVVGNPQYAYSLAFVCPFNAVQYNTSSKYDLYSIRLVRNATLSTGSIERQNFKIFPNPTKGILNIQSENDIKAIAIIDITGKTVYNQPAVSETINIENLERGIYIIKVSTADGVYSQKLIKD